MSKAHLTRQCQSILRRHWIGQIIEDEEDIFFLIDLFSFHPEWLKKQGAGIECISVGQSEFKTRCFVLHRCDGTKTDISFMKCLSKPTPEQEIKQACRTAIRPRIYTFRDAHVIYGTTRCSLTGEILTRENTHIDHYDLTFDEMFKLWSKTKDIEELTKKLASSADNDYGYRFEDPEVVREFVDFHDTHCQLRAVTRKANLSRQKTA